MAKNLTRSKKENDFELQALLKAYEIAGQEIISLTAKTEKVIGLGFTLLGALILYGLKEQIKEVLILAPVGAFVIALYSISVFLAVMALGGYKKYLEERINTILGKEILRWEIVTVRELVHGNMPGKTVSFLFAFLLLLISFLGLKSTLKFYGIEFFVGFAALLISLFVVSIASIVKMSKAFDKAYQHSKEGSNRRKQH